MMRMYFEFVETEKDVDLGRLRFKLHQNRIINSRPRAI